MKHARKAIAGLVLAIGAAGPAAASISTVNASNVNELTLWVFDQQTNKSYTRDLGVSVNSFLTTSAQTPVAGNYAFDPAATIPLGAPNMVNALGYSLVFQADPLLTSFFTSEELGRSMYQVIGAKGPAAQAGALTTSNSGAAAVGNVTNSQLLSFRNIDIAIGGANLLGTHATGANGSSATNDPDDISNVAKSLKNNFAASTNAFSTDAQVGTALSFYQLARNGIPAGNKANLFAYDGQWLLEQNGTLSYTVPVPEPETYALMLAGLALVGGIARARRKSA